MISNPEAIKKVTAEMRRVGYREEQITEWEKNPHRTLPKGVSGEILARPSSTVAFFPNGNRLDMATLTPEQLEHIRQWNEATAALKRRHAREQKELDATYWPKVKE